MNAEWQYDQHSMFDNLYHSLGEAYDDINKLRAENEELRRLVKESRKNETSWTEFVANNPILRESK